MSFAQRLQEAFKDSGLSQAELGRRVGLTRSTVNGYLMGHYGPKKDKIKSLAQVLKVNPDWLLGANVDKHGRTKIDLENSDNLYLDDKQLTQDEITNMIAFLRGYRAANKKN